MKPVAPAEPALENTIFDVSGGDIAGGAIRRWAE